MIRLNRYLAQTLGWSRRQADKAIEGGHVTVNGKKALLGQQVDPNQDTMRVYGKPVTAKEKKPTTILLYKPRGYVSTRKDPHGRKTVMQLLPKELQSLKPAGRLDFESEGLMIFTDNGDLINELTHPRYEKEKEYMVRFQRPITASLISKFQKGIRLNGGIAQVDSIQKINVSEARIRMHQGINRQIRRMAEACNNTVEQLIRTTFGPYELGNLKPGEWREV